MDKAFLRPRLCGGRFNDGGIPLEVLPDLLALQELVADVARSEYLREHPSERKAPPGFAENLKLKLTAIRPGSAIAEISFAHSKPALPGVPDVSDETPEFETYARQAADKIRDVIDAGQSDEALPGGLPSGFRKHLKKLGRSLGEEERIEFESPSSPSPTVLTPQICNRLVERLSVQEEFAPGTFLGRVPELDHDRRRFEFWPTGGSKIPVRLPDSHRETLMEAFNKFWNESKVSLTGHGVVGDDGKLLRLESIQDVRVLQPLDLEAQIDEIANLRDGWLDGDGAAPDQAGLEWFSTKFADLYPNDLPPAYLYPTPEGGLQAEWSVNGWELALEVDLKSHISDWYETGPGDSSYTSKLNLDDNNDWKWFGDRLRAKSVSDQ